MATSSIFANFTIRDDASARLFADAVEQSEKDSKWDRCGHVSTFLTDHDAIRALFAKGEKE